MGLQAAALALGRAGLPALTGALHDLLDDYALAIALLIGGDAAVHRVREVARGASGSKRGLHEQTADVLVRPSLTLK
jgi:hypothetical protein